MKVCPLCDALGQEHRNHGECVHHWQAVLDRLVAADNEVAQAQVEAARAQRDQALEQQRAAGERPTSDDPPRH